MRAKNYLTTIIGIMICAISFCIFFLPYNIVPSGIAGISIIFNKMFGISEIITICLLSMMFLIIGCIYLNKEEVKNALLGTLLFPWFIFICNLLFKNIDLSLNNNLLTAIVGGVSLGFGLGLVYRNDNYIGGIDLVNRILDRKININYSFITLITDIIIVVIGGLVFGFETFVYSMISIFIYRQMIEKVTVGIGDNRAFYIITTKPDEIKEMIIKDLEHGATILKGKGAYTKEERYIIFSVIPKRDYYKLKEGIKKIDTKAFYVVSSSYEVGGGK